MQFMSQTIKINTRKILSEKDIEKLYSRCRNAQKAAEQEYPDLPGLESVQNEMNELVSGMKTEELLQEFLKKLISSSKKNSPVAKKARTIHSLADMKDWKSREFTAFCVSRMAGPDKERYESLKETARQCRALQQRQREIPGKEFEKWAKKTGLNKKLKAALKPELEKAFYKSLEEDPFMDDGSSLKRVQELDLIKQVDDFMNKPRQCRTRTDVGMGYGDLMNKAVGQVFRDLFAKWDHSSWKPETWVAEPEDLWNTKDEKQICRALAKNTHYRQISRRFLKEKETLWTLEDQIPTFYPDLYPMARQMKRRFIVHSGPTNSGKTWQALQDLKQAENGVYLAPLRLLAYEVYESFMEDNVPCSMVTGEEALYTQGARIISSTCEMADFSDQYDVAVIDECQMAADLQRGSSLTAAILGLRAKTIHLCCSPESAGLLCRLIELCQDEYEVVDHYRKTKLSCQKRNFKFPQDVQKGDAIIVFGKRKVHAAAAELQQKKVKVSMIYGALPYSVRQSEAKKFRTGQTDVLVSTDAVGMGMNLPIKRVVLLEQSKFDGCRLRELENPEIRQICGRAGRFGIYDEGFAAGAESWRMIQNALTETPQPLTQAVIGLPKILEEADVRYSQALMFWNSQPGVPGFLKQDVDEEIEKAQWLEKITDDKEFVITFTTMTFDYRDDTVRNVWRKLAQRTLQKKYCYFEDDLKRINEKNLDSLETGFKILDVYYQLYRHIDDQDGMSEVMAKKQETAMKMIRILNSRKLKIRRCIRCGRPLDWKHKYQICDECFSKQSDSFFEERQFVQNARKKKTEAPASKSKLKPKGKPAPKKNQPQKSAKPKKAFHKEAARKTKGRLMASRKTQPAAPEKA